MMKPFDDTMRRRLNRCRSHRSVEFDGRERSRQKRAPRWRSVALSCLRHTARSLRRFE
ncbi:unnamed protein product, partial [Musa textilis]